MVVDILTAIVIVMTAYAIGHIADSNHLMGVEIEGMQNARMFVFALMCLIFGGCVYWITFAIRLIKYIFF